MKTKIGIIGGGNMGSAIIAGIAKQYSVAVCEQSRSRAQKLKKKYKVSLRNPEEIVAQSKVIILAVKPQNFDDVLRHIAPYTTKDKLFISIAAGITCQYIEKRLGGKARVVRTMPNLPVQVGEGVTGISTGKYATNSDLILTCRIFSFIGKAIVVDEKHMNAVTALSGSGPAYVFLFIEYMQNAAAALGLDKNLSNELVIQTLEGSLKLLKGQKKDAATLRKRVTSKGGTTQAALNVFQKSGTEKIFKSALSAAKKRAKELSQ